MTEEQVCETECKCKTCKYICKFLFLTGAIFVGTLLALLLANALQQPKYPPMPCNCMKHGMHGMERQLPMGKPVANNVMRNHKSSPRDVAGRFDRQQQARHPQQVPEKQAR